MDGWLLLPDGVTKKVIYAGKGSIPEFVDNSKVQFHYRASCINGDKESILDDSKKVNEPFELIIGKKFKLEIWESLIKTMRIDEVASFSCHPKHCSSYPLVAKSLRDIRKKKHCGDHNHDDHSGGHQCGFAAYSEGLGYSDLDEYMKEPTALTFQIELLRHTLPADYEPEVWSLSLEEKLKKIPIWKEEGNKFYKNGDFDKASEIYSQALGSLEQLKTREKPGTEEFLKLDFMTLPFLLNFSQCLLMKKDYYKAITHLTTVIEKDENNVKALYRRGKAYQSIYEFEKARVDYSKVIQLDNSLQKTCEKEIENVNQAEKQKNLEDKAKFKNVFNNF